MAHIFALYFLNAHGILQRSAHVGGSLSACSFSERQVQKNVEFLTNNRFHFSGSEIIPEQDWTQAVQTQAVMHPVHLTILFQAHF